MGEKYKGIDPKEHRCLTYTIRSGEVYIITCNKDRSKYFLYEVKDDKAVKTKKVAETPTELERYIQKKEDRLV